jgi:hypothetical protein
MALFVNTSNMYMPSSNLSRAMWAASHGEAKRVEKYLAEPAARLVSLPIHLRPINCIWLTFLTRFFLTGCHKQGVVPQGPHLSGTAAGL